MTQQRLILSALCLIASLSTSLATRAQSASAEAKPSDCSKLPRTEFADCLQQHYQLKTVYLEHVNASVQNDVNEVLVAVRNMADPSDKIYLVGSQNAISIGSYPEEIARVEAYIHLLDRPRKTFRATYTIAVIEDGKTIGTQHYSMVALDGQRVTLKEGDKVPVATGTYSTDNATAQTQFTYLDVGMNFDVTITSLANGVSIFSKVEQSSIGPTNTIAGVQEPVVRQSVLQGSSAVPLGKPLMLGSIDIPNSTRRLDIDILIEQIK